MTTTAPRRPALRIISTGEPAHLGIRVGRLVDTPQGRGAVTAVEFARDTLFVQLIGAPVITKEVKVGPDSLRTFTVTTWEETAFRYDEVTPIPAARNHYSPTNEADMDSFMDGHRTARYKPWAPAKPRPLSSSRFGGKSIGIGEIVAIGSLLEADGIAPTRRYIYAGRAAAADGVVVQDAVTGHPHFATKKSLIRTGADHTGLAASPALF